MNNRHIDIIIDRDVGRATAREYEHTELGSGTVTIAGESIPAAEMQYGVVHRIVEIYDTRICKRAK